MISRVSIFSLCPVQISTDCSSFNPLICLFMIPLSLCNNAFLRFQYSTNFLIGVLRLKSLKTLAVCFLAPKYFRIHTWQMMYGCELDDDGTTRGFHQFGYDGDDYVSFDKQTLTWTAANPRGETTKMRWDPNKALNLQTKGYLEGTCIEWLKKYVVYGAATLERKVHPEVFLTHKRTDSGMEATCYVTGFFPRDIEVMWQNGGARDLDIESGEVLPNEDGTYQVKKTLKLKKKPEELKKGDYSCRVAHIFVQCGILFVGFFSLLLLLSAAPIISRSSSSISFCPLPLVLLHPSPACPLSPHP
uniref:Class I histocompatibility antigen, F10 alpha chain-like n=1 Tax=Erpetoichthys calabaricus TaxID=27687 RepID=A0A8C4TLV9_ERPCA